MKKEAKAKTKKRRQAILGGSLIFDIPYCAKAKFEWWLKQGEHDVYVQCWEPWVGLYTFTHRMSKSPKFTATEAREIAEKLCHKIIDNLEFVIQHRTDETLTFKSRADNAQLPIYREYAEQESRRRSIETYLLAEAFKDDDDDDEAPENAMGEEYLTRAEEELSAEPVKLCEEIGPFTGDELKAHWKH